MTQSHRSLALRALPLALAGVLSASWGVVHADEGDQAPDNGKTLPFNGSPPVKFSREGIVTSANPYASEAGAKILERGGNAIDAAVAVAYALNVVEPQSAGIGGGGFFMIHLAKTGETFMIDSREKAPGGASSSQFVGVPNPTLQGVAVGVPGMVRGTALALERYGHLPLRRVLEPAIELADQGFAATPRYAAVSCNPRSKNSPEAEAVFCPNGAAPVVGSLIQNKALAETFRKLAAAGPDCFYLDGKCDIAKGVITAQSWNRPQEANGRGGTMTLADLAGYQPAIRKPVEFNYRGYKIVAAPPPSSGGIAIGQVLKMIEQYPIGDATQGFGFGSPKTMQVMADALRIAFADRSIWLGDPDFVSVPVKGLLNSNYLQTRGSLLRVGTRLTPNPTPGDPRPFEIAGLTSGAMLATAEPVTGPEQGTTHISVIDKWGNMVTYTNTIESSHGIGVFMGYRDASGKFVSTGALANNELTDFNIAPTINPYTGTAGYNDVQPGKRPRSSMTPLMVFTPEGKPLFAFGSPGGATIINSVLQATINLIDHRMAVADAIKAPRMSVTSTGSTITIEAGFPQASLDSLKAMGYTLAPVNDIGSVQVVAVDPVTGARSGGADARREGTVITVPRQ